MFYSSLRDRSTSSTGSRSRNRGGDKLNASDKDTKVNFLIRAISMPSMDVIVTIMLTFAREEEVWAPLIMIDRTGETRMGQLQMMMTTSKT